MFHSWTGTEASKMSDNNSMRNLNRNANMKLLVRLPDSREYPPSSWGFFSFNSTISSGFFCTKYQSVHYHRTFGTISRSTRFLSRRKIYSNFGVDNSHQTTVGMIRASSAKQLFTKEAFVQNRLSADDYLIISLSCLTPGTALIPRRRFPIQWH